MEKIKSNLHEIKEEILKKKEGYNAFKELNTQVATYNYNRERAPYTLGNFEFHKNYYSQRLSAEYNDSKFVLLNNVLCSETEANIIKQILKVQELNEKEIIFLIAIINSLPENIRIKTYGSTPLEIVFSTVNLSTQLILYYEDNTFAIYSCDGLFHDSYCNRRNCFSGMAGFEQTLIAPNKKGVEFLVKEMQKLFNFESQIAPMLYTFRKTNKELVNKFFTQGQTSSYDELIEKCSSDVIDYAKDMEINLKDIKSFKDLLYSNDIVFDNFTNEIALEDEEVCSLVDCYEFVFDRNVDYLKRTGVIFECDDCGELYTGELVQVANGDWVCESCLDNNYTWCYDCEEYYPSDEVTYLENLDRWVCDNCLDDYAQCSHCEDYIERRGNDYYEDDNGNVYCGNCINEYGYFINDDCDDEDEYEECGVKVFEYHHANVSQYLHLGNKVIKNEGGIYNYYHRELKLDKEIFGCGIELEVCPDTSKDYSRSEALVCANEIMNDTDNDYDFMYFMHDGSLHERGFECVTQVFDEEAMRKKLLPRLNRLCDGLTENNYISHKYGDYTQCGLHMHFSKYNFGEDEEEQKQNLAKVFAFFAKYGDELVKISRRKNENHYCQKLTTVSRILKDAVEANISAKKLYNEALHAIDTENNYFAHGEMINLHPENGKTIEFRLFRGTLKYESLEASLDFLWSIVKMCTEISVYDVLDFKKWAKYMSKETIEYVKSRNAFVDECNELLEEME